MSANYATATELRASGAPRTFQVMDQLSQLEQTVQEGLKIQDELRQRLSPILRSEPELGQVGGSDDKKAALVPLADRLNSLMAGIQNLNSGYSAVIRRLEI